MREDEKIAVYVLKVQNLIHLMKGCGEALTDKMMVENVMHMLASHFDHVIITIHESINLETLNLKDLISLFEAHELRIIERKWVQDSIQVMQEHTWKKNDSSNKFKGKVHKTQRKKSWVNP